MAQPAMKADGKENVLWPVEELGSDPAVMRKRLGLQTEAEASAAVKGETTDGTDKTDGTDGLGKGGPQPPRYANSRTGGRCQLPADQMPAAPPPGAWRKDGGGAGVVVRELGQGDDLPVGLPPEPISSAWGYFIKCPPVEVGVMESPAGPCVVDEHYERMLTMERLRVKEAEEERDALRKVVVRQQQDYDFCHEMSMDGQAREELLEKELGKALEMVKLKEAVIGMLRVRLEANAAAAGALKNPAGASSTALKSPAVKKVAKKKGGAGK